MMRSSSKPPAALVSHDSFLAEDKEMTSAPSPGSKMSAKSSSTWLSLAMTPLLAAIRLALKNFLDDSEEKPEMNILEDGTVLFSKVHVKSNIVNEVLLGMDLPFTAQTVYIERMEITLPWMNWVSGTVKVNVRTMIVAVQPISPRDRKASDVRSGKEKLIAKAMAALFKSAKKQTKAPGFLDDLLAKMRASVALKFALLLTRVHVRLADADEKASMGITINTLQLSPQNRPNPQDDEIEGASRADPSDKSKTSADNPNSPKATASSRASKETSTKASRGRFRALFQKTADPDATNDGGASNGAIMYDLKMAVGAYIRTSETARAASVASRHASIHEAPAPPTDDEESETIETLRELEAFYKKRGSGNRPLLAPMEITGSLRRDVNGTINLNISTSPIQINLQDQCVATLHGWLGHLEGYSLWKHYTLLDSTPGFVPRRLRKVMSKKRVEIFEDVSVAEESQTSVPARRWKRAGTAVMHALEATSAAGKHGIAELANNAKRKRDYQMLYLELCNHPDSYFHQKSASMDVTKARDELSKSAIHYMQRTEDQLPTNTLARWRLHVIMAGKLDEKKRGAATNLDQVDEIASGLLKSVPSGMKGKFGKAKAAGGKGSEENAVEQEIKETTVQLAIPQIRVNLTRHHGTTRVAVMTLALDALSVQQIKKNVAGSQPTSTLDLQMDELSVISPCVETLNGTADIVRLSPLPKGEGSALVMPCMELRVGETGAVSINAGAVAMTHSYEFMAHLEQFFLPSMEEIDWWPLMSTDVYRMMMRKGRLRYSVDELLRRSWWKFDHILMVVLKSSDDLITLGPSTVDLGVGPTSIKLLEPLEEKREAGVPPQSIVQISIPRTKLSRALHSDGKKLVRTQLSFEEAISFEALASLQNIRDYVSKMKDARKWQSDQGNTKRLAALVADRTARQQMQLTLLGGRGEEKKARIERAKLVEAVRDALKLEASDAHARQRHRRQEWLSTAMALQLIIFGVFAGMSVSYLMRGSFA